MSELSYVHKRILEDIITLDNHVDVLIYIPQLIDRQKELQKRFQETLKSEFRKKFDKINWEAEIKSKEDFTKHWKETVALQRSCEEYAQDLLKVYNEAHNMQFLDVDEITREVMSSLGFCMLGLSEKR